MAAGAPGLTLGHAVRPAEGAPRLKPGKTVSFASNKSKNQLNKIFTAKVCLLFLTNLDSGRATALFLPVVGELAREANLKMPPATLTVAVMSYSISFCRPTTGVIKNGG